MSTARETESRLYERSEMIFVAHALADSRFPSDDTKHTLYQIISVYDSNLWNVDGIKRTTLIARTDFLNTLKDCVDLVKSQ